MEPLPGPQHGWRGGIGHGVAGKTPLSAAGSSAGAVRAPRRGRPLHRGLTLGLGPSGHRRAWLELAEMKTAKRARAAVQKCLALINSCPRRDLPSAPEHPNIGTAAAARPRRGCSPLLDFREEAARPLLSRPLDTNCSFPPGRFLVGAGGFGTWVGEGGLLSLQPPSAPKPSQKLCGGQQDPFTPIKWDRSLLIPCQGQGPQHRAEHPVPLRWDGDRGRAPQPGRPHAERPGSRVRCGSRCLSLLLPGYFYPWQRAGDGKLCWRHSHRRVWGEGFGLCRKPGTARGLALCGGAARGVPMPRGWGRRCHPAGFAP